VVSLIKPHDLQLLRLHLQRYSQAFHLCLKYIRTNPLEDILLHPLIAIGAFQPRFDAQQCQLKIKVTVVPLLTAVGDDNIVVLERPFSLANFPARSFVLELHTPMFDIPLSHPSQLAQHDCESICWKC
jgi:hypothetical protein